MNVLKRLAVQAVTCGWVIALCASMSAAADGADEIIAELSAKSASITHWSADVTSLQYDPATGQQIREIVQEISTKENAIYIHQLMPEGVGASAYMGKLLGADNVYWSEFSVVDEDAIKHTMASKCDVNELASLFEQTSGLTTKVLDESELLLYCAYVPRLYSALDEAYTWEVLLRDADAVSLRGTLKDALVAKWANDPMLESHGIVMGAVELTCDSITGLPRKIIDFNHEGSVQHIYTFENVQTEIGNDSAFTEMNVEEYDTTTIDDGTQRRKERLSAIVEGTYTDFVEAEREGMEAGIRPRVEVGQNIADLTGPGLDGSTVALADYAGKIVLIDFWATWCPPCVADLPEVISGLQRYRDQGFAVIAISWDAKAVHVTDYLEEHPDMDWAQIWDEKVREGELSRSFDVKAIPTKIIVDRDGVVIDVSVGRGGLAEKLAEIFSESTD